MPSGLPARRRCREPVSVPKNLTLAPEVSTGRVSAASGELAALIATPPAGVERRPGVLAVPGYTGSKEDFIHLLPLLARAGHPAIAVDLRGQYESGGPEDLSAYTTEALGEDIASLLSAGEPIHVIGHSFGGLICREAVLSGAPARSLTLLCSGPAALGGTRGQLIELMRPLLEDGGVAAVWEASEAMDAAKPGAELVPADVRVFLKRRFLASPAAALLGMGAAVTSAPDRVDELRAAGILTFVAHGAADDAWTPAEQQEMATRLGSRYVVFEGTGHSPAVDVPETVAAALESFWSTVDWR
jgi:pimeloyl-ACP methyl ester carboxylesterase